MSTKALARTAGVLYLAVAILGGFSQLFVRASLRVAGDPAATAGNIASHATLFRVGFVTDLIAFAFFLATGVALYSLLRSVHPQVALAMLVLNAVSVATSALNMLNQLGALLLATQPAYTSGMSAQTAHDLVLFLVDLQQQGYLVSQVFFGLFLLPLGYLVYRSGFFPRILGIALMIGCGGYLAGVAATWLAPSLQSAAAQSFGMIGGLAEFAFLLWLIVRGAAPKAVTA